MSVGSSRSRLEGSVPPILPSVFDETNIMANTAVRHKIQQQQTNKKKKLMVVIELVKYVSVSQFDLTLTRPLPSFLPHPQNLSEVNSTLILSIICV